MLYPATDDVLADQESVTECCVVWTPVPERLIVKGVFVALLEIWMAPDELDASVGAKTTVTGTVAPAATV